MPCPTCIRALESGAHAVMELVYFHPELLPSIPERPDWRTISALLIQAAADIRRATPVTNSPPPPDLPREVGRD